MYCAFCCRPTRNTYSVSLAREDDDEAPKGSFPRIGGLQDSLMYWPAQMNAILKSKLVWYVARVYNAPGLSPSRQVRVSVARSEASSDLEHAREVECSITLQGLGKVLFACVMQYQGGPSADVEVPA